MPFSLTDWIQRRKIDAQVRSGRVVEHRRVGNPFHAVSIEPGHRACPEARAREGKRFLSAAAPMLPLKGCSNASCQCRYQHHEDRRTQRERRVNFANPHAHKMADRRAGKGRRLDD